MLRAAKLILFWWTVVIVLGLWVYCAWAHDPYTNIYNKAGVNCCTGDDCKVQMNEEQFIIKMNGGYILKKTNEFIEEAKTGISPDQHWHICRYDAFVGGPGDRRNGAPPEAQKGGVRCLLVPNGGV